MSSLTLTPISAAPLTLAAIGAVYANVVNVRVDFGARGDDSTDDATAFASALGELSAQGGGILFVPQGVYRISSALTVPTLVSIVGVGAASELKLTAAGPNTPITLSGAASAIRDVKITRTADNTMLRVGADRCLVENVHILVGTGTTRGPFSIDAAGTNSIVQGCTFENMTGSTMTANTNGTSNVRWLGNKFIDVTLSLNTNNTEIIVANNIVISSVLNQVGIHAANGSTGVTNTNLAITGNYVEAKSFGIAVEKTSNGDTSPRSVTITGNTIKAVSGASFHGISVTTCDHFSVSANVIDAAGITGLYFGIEVVSCNYGTISGNQVRGNSGTEGGVILDECVSVSVVGNQIYDFKAGGQGVRLFANSASPACSDNAVTGNTIFFTGTSATTAGVDVFNNLAAAVTSRNLIVGNSIRGGGGSSLGVRLTANGVGGTLDETLIGMNQISNCGTAISQTGDTNTLLSGTTWNNV